MFFKVSPMAEHISLSDLLQTVCPSFFLAGSRLSGAFCISRFVDLLAVMESEILS